MKTTNLVKMFSVTIAAVASMALTACGNTGGGNSAYDNGAIGIYGTAGADGLSIPIASGVGAYMYNGQPLAELSLDLYGGHSAQGINSKGTPLYVGPMAAAGGIRFAVNVPQCGIAAGTYQLGSPQQSTYDQYGAWGPLVLTTASNFYLEVAGYTAMGPGTSYFGAVQAPYRLGVLVNIYVNNQVCASNITFQ